MTVVAALRVSVAAFCLVVAVTATGCSAPAAPNITIAPPSASPLSAEERAEAPLVNTSWSGIDSAGDVTVLTLERDHTITVVYNDESWADPADTWQLRDGVLTMTVRVNEQHGSLVYSAPYSDGATVLEATAVTTVSGRTLTVTLTRV